MTDIQSILNELEIPVKVAGEHHHTTQNFVQICCPFCDKDGDSWSMGIALSGSHSHCWRCGYHSVENVLIELTGLSYPQVKELTKDIQTTYIEPTRARGKLVLPKGIMPLQHLPRHQKYLKERGYKWKEIEKLWGVKGIPGAANYAWRLFIPVYFHGEMVSWTTRTISKDPTIPRYLSAPPERESISHKELLYGEDHARHAIVVVEGTFDAWRIGVGAVATLGVGYSQSQVVRMSRFPVRAIAFDSEPAAQKRARQLRDDLAGLEGETYLVELESGKDASEASEEEIRRLRKAILT
jgi:DNA primase